MIFQLPRQCFLHVSFWSDMVPRYLYFWACLMISLLKCFNTGVYTDVMKKFLLPQIWVRIFLVGGLVDVYQLVGHLFSGIHMYRFFMVICKRCKGNVLSFMLNSKINALYIFKCSTISEFLCIPKSKLFTYQMGLPLQRSVPQFQTHHLNQTSDFYGLLQFSVRRKM